MRISRMNFLLNRVCLYGILRKLFQHMKPKVISLFSGAGGLDIGFHQAGFETSICVERDSACCETLRHNLPNIPVLECDLAETSTQQILKEGNLKPLEAALVIGGPPCQSFSLAGKRMGLNDPRGKLVLEFIRVVREALPQGFVMENVKGMINWSRGAALRAIIEEAERPIEYKGKTFQYKVAYKVLNSADFGVPQFRERVFIVGNRLGKEFDFPEPSHVDKSKIESPGLFDSELSPYVSVGDAIGGLPPASPPSEVALRVSKTIKERIRNHGY